MTVFQSEAKQICIKLDSKTQIYRIQWEIQFLLNTLKLEVQVIDALIAQLSMCPFLHLQGEPLVNVAWMVGVFSVCSCVQEKKGRQE